MIIDKDITVIVPVHNGDTTIEDTIISLERQKDISLIKEILIINDKSSDNSLLKINSLINIYKNIRLINNKENLGLAGCYNMGIKKCSTDFFILTHQDITLCGKRCISSSVEPLTDSNVVATFPVITLPFNIWRKFGFWQRCMFSRFVGKTFTSDLIGKFDCYNKKLLLDSVGFFRPEIFRTAGEDTDMKMRIIKKGLFVRKAVTKVLHIHSKESNFPLIKWFKKEAQLAEARGAFLKTHGVRFLIFAPTIFFREFLILTAVLLPVSCIPAILIFLYSVFYTHTMIFHCPKDSKIAVLPFINIGIFATNFVFFLRGLITGRQKL